MRIFLTFVFIAWIGNVNAWDIVGKKPPSTHTRQEGTYNVFETINGARKYYLIDESSVCDSSIKQIQIPSGAYTIQQPELFKRYKSPTGALAYYQVSYYEQCKAINPPPPPPQPDINYVGLRRLYINPTPTNLNDCTCMRLNVLEKLDSGNYQVDVDLWDCATVVNNQRVCNVK